LPRSYRVDAEGKVVFERKLTAEQVDVVEQRWPRTMEYPWIAYDGDNLLPLLLRIPST
jgi:hypothetical protein